MCVILLLLAACCLLPMAFCSLPLVCCPPWGSLRLLLSGYRCAPEAAADRHSNARGLSANAVCCPWAIAAIGNMQWSKGNEP